MPRPYQILYALSVLVTLMLAVWTGISAAGAERLGLTPQSMAWLAIGAGALGVLNGFLPQLQKTPGKHTRRHDVDPGDNRPLSPRRPLDR